MENPTFSAKAVSILIRVLLGFLFASLITGQLIRFALSGQGGGVILSDISSVLFIMGIGTTLLVGGIRPKVSSVIIAFLVILPFLVWGVCVLMGRSDVLGWENVAIALLYWARLASILVLYPLGAAVMGVEKIKEYTKQAFVGSYLVLLVLGFLQLLVFPSLEGLVGGWDPHNQRMVATWLDPNFFGAFLVIALPSTLVWMRISDEKRLRIARAVLLVVASAAILLTRSRSTYVASVVAVCVCGIVLLASSSIASRWKKVIVPAIVTIIIICGLAIALLQERATQIFIHDPTVALRIDAYGAVWERIVGPNILFGVGYNAYQFAAQDAGLISDFLIHSRSGSDSSILTLLATTGVVGAILFLVPILVGCVWSVRRWLYTREYQSLLFMWVTVFLLVHSQFENSLFYPHLLIPYIFIAILTL